MPAFLVGEAEREEEVVDEEDLEEENVMDGFGVLMVGFVVLVSFELVVIVFVETTLDLWYS